MNDQLVTHHRTLDCPVIEGSTCEFEAAFNRIAFQFGHSLSDHPLFDLHRLLDLSKRTPNDLLYYDAGDIKITQRWDQTPRTQLTADQLIDRIENAGAWVVMKYVQFDPDYRSLLEQVFAEVKRLVGAPFPKRIKKFGIHFFITSPNRITPYHIDRDCNYLMQIRGTKQIAIFDKADREVLSETEIEGLWQGDKNAAVFKEHLRDRGHVFDLSPGSGVHIPVHAPHWVKNGNNISVTMAMTFHFPDSVIGNIYRWNHYLRKAGLKPTPPGRSRVLDALKTWSMGGARGLYTTFKSLTKKSNANAEGY